MGYQPTNPEPMSINRSRTPPTDYHCCRYCCWSDNGRPAEYNLTCQHCELRKMAEKDLAKQHVWQIKVPKMPETRKSYPDTADVTFEVAPSDIEVEWLVVKENEHE